MIEIPTSGEGPQEVAVAATTPDVLPILPLRDSVPFPRRSRRWRSDRSARSSS